MYDEADNICDSNCRFHESYIISVFQRKILFFTSRVSLWERYYEVSFPGLDRLQPDIVVVLNVVQRNPGEGKRSFSTC